MLLSLSGRAGRPVWYFPWIRLAWLSQGESRGAQRHRRCSKSNLISSHLFGLGIPTSDASQEILHWQRRTMEAMYTTIARSLADANIEGFLPTDFLMFFCLAKRESPEDVDKRLSPPPRGSHAEVILRVFAPVLMCF